MNLNITRVRLSTSVRAGGGGAPVAPGCNSVSVRGSGDADDAQGRIFYNVTLANGAGDIDANNACQGAIGGSDCTVAPLCYNAFTHQPC